MTYFFNDLLPICPSAILSQHQNGSSGARAWREERGQRNGGEREPGGGREERGQRNGGEREPGGGREERGQRNGDGSERREAPRAPAKRHARTPEPAARFPFPAETCPNPRTRSPVPVPRRDMPEPPNHALAPLLPFFPTSIVCMGLFSLNYKSISVIYFYLSLDNSIIFILFLYILFCFVFSPYLCNSLNL